MDSNIQNNTTKGKPALKTAIVDRIKTDGILHGKVADAVDVVPASLVRLLLQNHSKLTLPGVLAVISEHTGIEIAELLEYPACEPQN